MFHHLKQVHHGLSLSRLYQKREIGGKESKLQMPLLPSPRYCDAAGMKSIERGEVLGLYGAVARVSTTDDYVIWQPQPFNGEQNVKWG